MTVAPPYLETLPGTPINETADLRRPHRFFEPSYYHAAAGRFSRMLCGAFSVLIDDASVVGDHRCNIEADLERLALVAEKVRPLIERTSSHFEWPFVPAIEEVYETLESIVFELNERPTTVMAAALDVDCAGEGASANDQASQEVGRVQLRSPNLASLKNYRGGELDARRIQFRKGTSLDSN